MGAEELGRGDWRCMKWWGEMEEVEKRKRGVRVSCESDFISWVAIKAIGSA